MLRKHSRKSSFIPLLIVFIAICVWIFDTYRGVDKGSFAETSKTRETVGASPHPPGRSGLYETYIDCTLAQDRTNDGDSFRVRLPDGRAEIIRLYFVDSPESAFKSYRNGQNNHRRIEQQAADMGGITPQQAVEIGKKAKIFTLAILEKSPFTIHTAWDSPFNDRRYHAFVEVTIDGKPRFLHELLVEKGLARIHTKGAPLPDGISQRKQETHLLKLQSTAKANESGAWGL